MQKIVRRCDGCTACCAACGIGELKKPMGQVCEHECEQGCAIYTKKPAECSQFQCAWLQGIGDESHRPDLVGLVPIEIPFWDSPRGHKTLLVFDVSQNVGDSQLAASWLERMLVENWLVMLRSQNTNQGEFHIHSNMPGLEALRKHLLDSGGCVCVH